MRILGTDPGGTTGWGLIELSSDERPRINIVDLGEVKNEEELEPLIKSSDLVVIEYFRIRPGKQDDFIYKDLHASEAIGVIKALARMNNVQVQMQSSAVKPVGYGFAGLKYQKGKSGKGMHQKDALAHAVWYAVKHLHAIPPSAKKSV